MSQPGRRPNILWICTDSQRWDTLGCYGNRLVRTPHTDRLAAEGVLFENAFAQSPLCMPSRGSFLTGRYPVTNRLRQNGQVCPPDLKLITRIVADEGYVCGLAGKLHINACDNRLLLRPEWWRQDKAHWFKGIEPRIDDGYSEFHWDHAANLDNPSSAYVQWLKDKGAPLDEMQPREDCPYVQQGRPSERHQVTFCAEKAIQFIEGHAGRPYPWLFSMNVFDPHYVFDPPEEYLRRYLERLDEIPLPNFEADELDNKPEPQRKKRNEKYDCSTMTPREHRMVRAAYWAMCDHIDVQVGRVLEALERSSQRDNTIVLFMSDHGEMLGDHGLYTKGPFFYDAAIRVPLIVSWPGHLPEGRRIDGLVELTDLSPTLLEAAGLPRDPGMQGLSLLSAMQSDTAPESIRPDIYCEYYNANPDRHYATVLRNGSHKLVVFHGISQGELYDLEQDPNETHNRWDDAAYAQIKTALLIRMTARMAFTADPLPPRIGVF